MTPLKIWLVIAGLTCVTLLTRSALLLVHERIKLPVVVQKALRYAPVCALTAIITPEILLHDGSLNLSLHNPHWISALSAFVCYLLTRSMIATIIVGLSVLEILRLPLFN